MEWRGQQRGKTTAHSEAFATSQVRENEQTSRKQVPGVGSATDAAGNQRNVSGVWAGGGGFGEEKDGEEVTLQGVT